MHTDATRYNRWPRLTALALRWKLYRVFKIVRGVLRTYLSKNHFSRKIDHLWWENYYAVNSINDAHTVEPGKALYPTLLHYNSVENIILGQLYNRGVQIDGAAVLDIGSGAGHWIDFYRNLGAKRIDAVELSSSAADALRAKYADVHDLTIHNRPASELEISASFDIINAIGVMFHIVDDTEFELTVRRLTTLLNPGGHLIVGGHFGWLDNLNVQFDVEGRVNKRLRSKRHWRRLLSTYTDIRVYANRGYKLIDATLPENNILIARK